MAAAFQEILPNSGFDSTTPTGGPGLVVPYKGSAVVMLDGGSKLKVDTGLKPMLAIDEIKDQRYQHALVEAQYPSVSMDKALNLALLKTGALRIFKITGNALVGIGAKIEAMNPFKKSEATLKVIVLKQKRVKVAIRPVQVRDDKGVPVFLSGKLTDPQVLVDQMNAI